MKEVMAAAEVPTSAYSNFVDVERACAYVREKNMPIVIKADGLAAEGVTVAETIDQAEKAIFDALEDNAFGAAGSSVVIEDFLEGEEASILALIDGENIVLLASSQIINVFTKKMRGQIQEVWGHILQHRLLTI